MRGIYDAALADVELWNKAAAAQLDAQVRERRRSFVKRAEAIERIQEAAGSLKERIQELNAQAQEITDLQARLDLLSAPLLDEDQAKQKQQLRRYQKTLLISD